MLQQIATTTSIKTPNPNYPDNIISNHHSPDPASKLAPPNWLGFLQNKLNDEGIHQKVLRAHALHTFRQQSQNPYYNFTPPKYTEYINIQGFSVTQLLYHIQTLKTNECIVKVLKIDYARQMKYMVCVFIVELDSDCTSKAITVDTRMSKHRQKQTTNQTSQRLLQLHACIVNYQRKWLKEHKLSH